MSEAYSEQPIVVRHESGKKFSAQVRSHRVITDQPERAGGTDTAPTPLELLGASLGSCVALYVQQFCVARGLPFEGMRVEIDQKNEKNPHRVGSFSIRLVMPEELPEHYISMLERVVESCPVHNTLRASADFTIEILVPVA